MHRLLSITCLIAAILLVAAGGWMNFRFLSGQAHHASDATVLGMTSIAADIMKAILPPLVAIAWTRKERIVAGVGTLTFIVLAVFAFASAVGFSAERRNESSDIQQTASARHAILVKQLAALEARSTKLGEQRASAVVAAEMAVLKSNPRWLASAHCIKPGSARLCQRKVELESELTRAELFEGLSANITRVQADIIAAREAGALVQPEGQGNAIARMLGLSKAQAGDLTLFWIALVVELGSGFGVLIALAGNPFGSSWKTLPAPDLNHIEVTQPLARPEQPVEEKKREPIVLRSLVKRRSSVLHDPPPS